jgi:ribonuclease BN (tRNA processing enzyme)
VAGEGGGHNILVDAGFYREQFFKQWPGIADYVKPSEAIARVGLKPEDITDVVISHMHWDHADGLDLFPKAKIWLQKDELEYYAGSAWQSRRTHGGIDPDDVLAAVKLNLAGRVGLVNGDAQRLLPGIVCYTGGKHTYASQYVGVNTAAVPSCSRATTCTCTKTWRSARPARRSTTSQICERRIA